MKKEIKLRKYHAPVWSEPVIMEMGHKGERGIRIGEAEVKVKAVAGDPYDHIPPDMRRKEPQAFLTSYPRDAWHGRNY
jgi:glycine dehydrogenase subunit 2